MILAVLLVLVPAALAAQQEAPAGKGTYSLDFVDTELSDVVRALAVQSGTNIAVSAGEGSQAKAKVTLHLQNVCVEDAIRVIAGLSGLNFAQVNANTYVLGDEKNVGITQIKALGNRGKVLTLRLTQKSLDLDKLLARVAPEVSCYTVPGTRSLVMVGPPAALEAAEQCLVGVVGPDIAQAETMVYQVQYANCGELRDALMRLLPELIVDLAPRTSTPRVGIKVETSLATLTSPQTSAEETKSAAVTGYDQDTGADQRATDTGKETSPITSLIITGAPSSLEKARVLLAQLDIAPKMVTISATITEVRSEATDRLGIDWHGLGGESGFVIGESQTKKPLDSAQVVVGGDGAALLSRSLKLGSLGRSHLGIAATINALVSEGKARILSRPKITLLDGRQATIHSGEKIWYPQIVGYTPLGGQIVQATEIATGVTLAVNPRITPNGDLLMTLVPTVSDIAPSRFAGYPTITERSVITTVRVRNGETLVLGGLMRDENVETRSEVPFLSKIPLLGELFKSRTKSPRHSEVLIFITPQVVEDGSTPAA
jgi:type II secretory pathway component GspD/PulD (secretin)